ncbi:MAG: sigma factor SigF [Prochlorococcus sp.]|jgi:hypothetical protein
MFSTPCFTATGDSAHRRNRLQQRKLEMLLYWRDGLERRLSAVKASIDTLEKQIQRDQQPAN